MVSVKHGRRRTQPGTGRAPGPLSWLPVTFSVSGAARTEARRERGGALHMPRGSCVSWAALRSPKTGTALLPGTGAQPFPLRPFLPFFIIPAGQLRCSAPRAAASRTRRSLRRQVSLALPPHGPSVREPRLASAFPPDHNPSSFPTAAGDSTPRSRPQHSAARGPPCGEAAHRPGRQAGGGRGTGGIQSRLAPLSARQRESGALSSPPPPPPGLHCAGPSQ